MLMLWLEQGCQVETLSIFCSFCDVRFRANSFVYDSFGRFFVLGTVQIDAARTVALHDLLSLRGQSLAMCPCGALTEASQVVVTPKRRYLGVPLLANSMQVSKQGG
eukprot:2423495-Amphidinium_carterae.1